MTNWDRVCALAHENYGIVTSAEVSDFCESDIELPRWKQGGRLEQLARGVYRLAQRATTPYDTYAAATAIVSPDAAIWGESVLAMHDLALVNPPQIEVAVHGRIRKTLPAWIKLVHLPKNGMTEYFQGIRTQRLSAAVRLCQGRVLNERLLSAVDIAELRGEFRLGEADALRKELSNG